MGSDIPLNEIQVSLGSATCESSARSWLDYFFSLAIGPKYLFKFSKCSSKSFQRWTAAICIFNENQSISQWSSRVLGGFQSGLLSMPLVEICMLDSNWWM